MLRNVPLALVVAALFAMPSAFFAPPAVAQSTDGFIRCGDPNLILIFKNPDLQVNPSDGLIHASGYFFIQFQAIGERALDIEKFAFSFGKPIPRDAQKCDMPVNQWFTGGNSLTGAYLYRYRADDDPRDGFFVPINTTNVPDGEYGAAVSAFDASGQEIVRYYATAIVENGCPLGWRHPDCAKTYKSRDRIQPWPLVLPGDGDQTHPAGGLTIEFAEELAQDPEVWITPHDGVAQRVPVTLLGNEGCRMYDDDVVPDNPLVPSALQARCWGPVYHWAGTIRLEDIIRVRAVDTNGNQVEKILHIGDPTIGGRIVLAYPELEVIGSGQQKTAGNLGKATFPFQFKNVGNGSAHGNLLLDTLPEGLRAKFDKDHVVTGPGQTHHANLTVTALESLTPGTYEITGRARYQRAGQEDTKDFKVSFVLPEKSNNTGEEEAVVKGSRPDETLKEEPIAPTAAPEEAGPAETKGFLGVPGPTAAIAFVAATLAVLVLPRRRER